MTTNDQLLPAASGRNPAGEACGVSQAKRNWIADVLGDMRRLNVIMRERYGMPRTLRHDRSLRR